MTVIEDRLRELMGGQTVGQRLNELMDFSTIPGVKVVEPTLRMPVILEHDNVAPWLSGEAGMELLMPAAEEKLTSWPVSTHVNKTGGADGATLIDKVA